MEELRKILPSVFRQHVKGSRPAVVEILVPLWPQIVGAPLAEHCRPAEFVAGTLTLIAACPSWAIELRRITEEIRARVNSYLGAPVTRRVKIREVKKLVPRSLHGLIQPFAADTGDAEVSAIAHST
jgi:predicted nucleic acid-binding Zn ribbon protein